MQRNRNTDLKLPKVDAIRLPEFHLVSESNYPEIFTDFFQYDCAMVIWRRTISPKLHSSISELMKSNHALEFNKSVSPQSVLNEIFENLPGYDRVAELTKDIAELVRMFCNLFDQKQAVLRLETIKSTTCPRFHVDNVPCRLITTYSGSCTQWLPDQFVDRSKLGTGNNGLPDELSGIFQSVDDIKQLTIGDVALMKGKLWAGNENAGLVHRSPILNAEERRLLLTLDFA